MLPGDYHHQRDAVKMFNCYWLCPLVLGTCNWETKLEIMSRWVEAEVNINGDGKRINLVSLVRLNIVKNTDGLKLIFLVSRPVGDDADVTQELLEEEHVEHADILQTDIEDGHRKLGYKILTGITIKLMFY